MREGQMRRFISEDDVRKAIFQPPDGTRAFFRGRAVAKFNREIESIQWDEIAFASNGDECAVSLPHPSHDKELDRLNAAIRDARSFSELMKRLKE
jgi:proteasome accessory factor A